MARRYSNGSLNEAASQGFDLGVEGRRKRSLLEEEERRRTEAAQAQHGMELQRLLAGKAYDASTKEAAEAREGEHKALAIDEVLRGDLALSRRLGRTQRGQDYEMASEFSPETAQFAGEESYRPLAGTVRGKGAGEAAGLLKERMKELTQGDIATNNANASADRLAAALRVKESEGDKNRTNARDVATIRTQAVKDGIALRRELAAARAEFDRWKVGVTEAGKNARTDVTAGAFAAGAKAPAAAQALQKAQEKLSNARIVANSMMQDPASTPEDKDNAMLTVQGWQKHVDELNAFFTSASQAGQRAADKTAPKVGAPAPNPRATKRYNPATGRIEVIAPVR